MKKVTIVTPENIEVEYRCAGIGSRLVASFLDYFFQGVIYLLIILILAKMGDPLRYIESQNSYALALGLLIIAIINYGYFTVLEMIMDGRTPGKKILGLRTIRKNGQPMDVKHSLIRNLFKILVDNYLIGIIMIFVRDDKSRIGDILSSTMVIEEEKVNLYLTDTILPENIKDSLTEEDKSLLLTYIQEIDNVLIGKERLQEKILIYFKSKYSTLEEELVQLITTISTKNMI